MLSSSDCCYHHIPPQTHPAIPWNHSNSPEAQECRAGGNQSHRYFWWFPNFIWEIITSVVFILFAAATDTERVWSVCRSPEAWQGLARAESLGITDFTAVARNKSHLTDLNMVFFTCSYKLPHSLFMQTVPEFNALMLFGNI